jgi:hypothetical protein
MLLWQLSPGGILKTDKMSPKSQGHFVSLVKKNQGRIACPQGDGLYRDASSGDASSGDESCGDASSGDASSGDESCGDASSGYPFLL